MADNTTNRMSSLHLTAPVRFAFGNPPKLVMEFKASSTVSSTDEIIRDPHFIQLFSFDWTVSNYSMIKCVSEAIASPIFRVGPCENMEMKILLWRNGDNLKIEVQLSKETKLTEEMKIKESNCPLMSKSFIKNILDLEFLDSNGKTIDYYMSLPYEFKYINTSKVFAWIIEENVSRFISNDELTIRAKLSIRYMYHDETSDVEDSLHAKNTKVLREDMKKLFNDRSRFPDILIKVGGQFILAHKSILYTHCPYFAEMPKSDFNGEEQSLKLPSNISNVLKQDFETIYIPNEKADVFFSILHFIYCRQFLTTNSVNDFSLYEFARKYSVRELSMLMMPSEIKVHSEIRVEKSSYTWYVKNFSALCRTGFTPLQSPHFKTVAEADISWCVVIFSLDSQNITLNLQRNSGFNLDVQTTFKLAVCKANGSVHDWKEFKHLFTSKPTINCHPGFMNSVSRFCITPDLLFNDTLTVCCDLVVSTGAIVSKLKHIYPGQYLDIDLAYWSNNFRDLFEKERYSDATLIVEDKEYKIHKAILSTRSPVFARMFESDMEEKCSGCVHIEDISSSVMHKALLYIYTGEIEDLTMAHVPELYRTADKYELMDLKARCSEFIMKNMDAESACEILILADLFGDEKMKNAAKYVICRNAADALLSPHGIELITNHSLLARDVLESLSVVFCSLPPQDTFEKSPGTSTSPMSLHAASRRTPIGPGPSLIHLLKTVSLNK